MQETIIEPHTINNVIQEAFGSYEKFVMSLIDKRAELENEKLKLTDRLKKVSREQNLIKDVLIGFHGKKINGQYYDAISNKLNDKKPQPLPNQLIDKTPMEAVNDLLQNKREEINQKAGKELVKVRAPIPTPETKISLQSKVRSDYTNDIVASLKENYLTNFSEKEILEVINHNDINKSFLQGKSVNEFTKKFAHSFGLAPKVQKQKMVEV